MRQERGDPLRILGPVALHREQVRRAQGEMVEEGGEHRLRPGLPAGGEDRAALHENPAQRTRTALLTLDVGEILAVVAQGEPADGPAEPPLVITPASRGVDVGGGLLPESLVPIRGLRTVDDRDLSCHEPSSFVCAALRADRAGRFRPSGRRFPIRFARRSIPLGRRVGKRGRITGPGPQRHRKRMYPQAGPLYVVRAGFPSAGCATGPRHPGPTAGGRLVGGGLRAGGLRANDPDGLMRNAIGRRAGEDRHGR